MYLPIPRRSASRRASTPYSHLSTRYSFLAPLVERIDLAGDHFGHRQCLLTDLRLVRWPASSTLGDACTFLSPSLSPSMNAEQDQTLPCAHCSLLHYAFSQFLTSGRGRYTSVSETSLDCMQALTTSMSRAWWLCPCPDACCVTMHAMLEAVFLNGASKPGGACTVACDMLQS